jgi:choline dehydrogenase-like flavoprotein
MAESSLSSFQASPYATLVSGATVCRLHADESGRIAGAEAKDLDRNVKVVRARAYVIACGGLESPRLLLLSRSHHFPNGIGNSYDWVGRCFMEHRTISFHGRVRRSSFQIYPQVGRSFQFDEEFRRRGLGSLLIGFILLTVRQSDFSLRDLGRLWDGVTSALDRISRPELRISASPEMPPFPENRVTLDSQVKDYFGSPAVNLHLNESEKERRVTQQATQLIRQIYANLNAEQVRELDRGWSHHHMGTCRMGSNPKTSVVDRNLRVHGTSNLFVAGSSVFVTSGSANPTLTLTALSLRLADYLHAQLQDRSLSTDGHLLGRWSLSVADRRRVS